MRKATLLLLSALLLALVANRAYADDAAVVEKVVHDVEEATAVPEGLVASLQEVIFVAHLEAVAEVPREIGHYTWQAARAIGEDPLELAALLISEHSGPAIDFSFETTLANGGHGVTYELDSVGSRGEVGLFQQDAFWVRKANKHYGTDWKEEDLYDPWVNTQIAAYQMRSAKRRHAKKCEGKRSNLHTWVAHWKCATKARNAIRGQCRWAQQKYEKLLYSLTQYETPNLKEVGKEHNKVLRERMKQYEKSRKRRLLKSARVLWKKSGLSTDDPVWQAVKEMSADEIKGLIRNLEADLGYFDDPPWAEEGE